MAEKSKRKKKKSAFSLAMGSVFPQKGDGILESLRKIVFLISVIVFAVCAYLIFDYFYENYQNRQLYDDIADIYIGAETEELPEESDENQELNLLPGAESLLEVNPDTVGYINIPGMVISYPVVQKTTEEEAEYYLHVNFMNQEARAGAIFLDWRAKFNAKEQSDNLVIYGHDMKDGSMFGTLRNYKKDDYVEFYKNHAIIELNSNYEEAKYKIFGCFIIDAGMSESEIFDYYNYIDFSGEQEFYEYVNEVKKRSLILNDVDVKYGDKLVTLSTCSQEFSDSRFFVVSRKLSD
jgi:sortase B